MRHKMQRGFSLVTAIFLVVVLTALGAVMMTFFTAQQQSSALDLLGTRAYQAARVGVEWSAYGVSQTARGTLWAGCTAAPGTALPALGGTLAPFTVTVICASIPFDEGARTVAGGNPLYVYNITSTAVLTGAAPGGTDYVERVINVSLGR
jgi:MSHA biogenesis protein MshP